MFPLNESYGLVKSKSCLQVQNEWLLLNEMSSVYLGLGLGL